MIRVRLERRQETAGLVQIALPLGRRAGDAGPVQRPHRARRRRRDRRLMAACSSRTFETTYDHQDTLVKAAPMIFTGLAVAVAFRAKFWNIGAEGQLMAGAVRRLLRRRAIPAGLLAWCR